mgnify:CR=1 FL=1|tara:strand:- start:464 stop:664 length:201 start_codon:yes stop_codon:yes gene_type:complete
MSKEEIFYDVNGKGYLKIRHIDKATIYNPTTLEEKIEHVKSLFEFEEDKTIMNKMIEELKNQKEDD